MKRLEPAKYGIMWTGTGEQKSMDWNTLTHSNLSAHNDTLKQNKNG
jgi:hypothetical protein